MGRDGMLPHLFARVSLSILACAYILASLHWYTWVIFAGWVAVFLVFYMLYGRKHSVLGQERGEEPVVEEK